MKVKDVLTESQFVVIQKGRAGFRVDPDPTHHHENWEKAWSEDIAKAHPFTQKQARKFLRDRANDSRTEMEARRDLKFVPVDVIDGTPTLPTKEKKGVLSWLRSA